MADESSQAIASLAGRTRRGCAWFFLGFFLTGAVGLFIAIFAIQQQVPWWVVPIGFFAPLVLFVVVFGRSLASHLMQAAQEASRNVPSPESLAARYDITTTVTEPGDQHSDLGSNTTLPVINTTPGKVLTHRLPRSGMPHGCEFGCAVIVALFWNSLVGYFVYRQVIAWNQGGGFLGGWLTTALWAPFVFAGLVLIAKAVYAALRWIVASLAGTIDVELSLHPVYPGCTPRISLTQRGLFPLSQLTVQLVCTEETTYVAGTSKSRAAQEVTSYVLIDPEQNPESSQMLETTIQIPIDAMHSFAAPNNEINWTIRVRGRVLGLPFSADYAIGIIPGPNQATG
jgi:hypothetical protein